MVMSVYLVLKFSSGLKGLKREGMRSETISAPAVPAHQKQTLTSKKSMKFLTELPNGSDVKYIIRGCTRGGGGLPSCSPPVEI
jgi:hypothetical protein